MLPAYRPVEDGRAPRAARYASCMSRLPTPDPGWEASTEGDLDADLTEEAGSSLDDWTQEEPRGRGITLLRIIGAVMLVVFLGGFVAQALLAR